MAIGIPRLAILVALILGATAARAAEPPSAEDYLRVLANGPWPLELLAYCYARVDRDPALREVGTRWRTRNDGLLAAVADKAAEAAIPEAVRRQADEAALAAIRRLAGRQYDQPAWCRMLARVIDGGAYDIDRRSDLEAALKRIFGKP